MNKNGFTLIELLMVMAIIAILSGMLLPAIHKTREKGRQANCISNQRQLAVAAVLYANDWNSQLPGSLVFNSAYYNSYFEEETFSLESSAHALGSIGEYCRNTLAVMQCPSSHSNISYGLNQGIAGERLNAIINPSITMFIIDSESEQFSTYTDPDDGNEYIEAVTFRHNTSNDNLTGIAIASYVDGHVDTLHQAEFTQAGTQNNVHRYQYRQ